MSLWCPAWSYHCFQVCFRFSLFHAISNRVAPNMLQLSLCEHRRGACDVLLPCGGTSIKRLRSMDLSPPEDPSHDRHSIWDSVLLLGSPGEGGSVVVYAGNPSYSRGGDQKDCGLRPTWAKKLERPHLNKQGKYGVCAWDPSYVGCVPRLTPEKTCKTLSKKVLK
jgi:hypothetical protein